KTLGVTSRGLEWLDDQEASAQAIDNSAIGKPEFREHKATYGLVYRLPEDVTDILDSAIYPPLRERLLKLGLVAEARTFNLQHVTVIHVHNAAPSTPQKMLTALPEGRRVV